MKFRHPLLSLVFWAQLSASAQAIEAALPAGWTEATRSDNLIVFYKDHEDVHAREVLAYTEMDAPPAVVFGLVTDFESWPQFMPYSKESKILTHLDPDTMILYQVASPPLVSDRDYYLRVHVIHGTAGNGGVFKSEWVALPDYQPERSGLVRMRINQGSWTYDPIDGGKRTRLTYSLLSHPAGSIPNWIANRSNLSLIPNLFKAVRQRIAREHRP